MSKRLLILMCAAALITAACSNFPAVNVSYGKGQQFVPYVADNLDDAGLGNAIALDNDGVPFVSYMIFPGAVAKGAIALPRPIGAPFITTGGDDPKNGAAIGVASLSGDGVWTRGAAAQVPVAQAPAGITVPYGPDTVGSLVGATADNTNGTDIAIDATGGKHVVWAGPDGIWYAGGATSFAKQQVDRWSPPLDQAGPVGRPSVAVDAENHPWVAYAIDSPDGQEIRVATRPGGPSWTTQVAAKIPYCLGCPQPGPVEIAVTSGGALVVYVDGSTSALMAARLVGKKWTIQTVQVGIDPSGLSLAIGKDGTPWVAYYTGDGSVNLATTSGAGWTTVKVASAKPGDGTDKQAETTGVAITDDGTVFVAWYDSTKNAVSLASGDGNSFTPVDTGGTSGGGFPSLAVAADGSRVFLAWYDLTLQNLLVGVLGDASDVLVAEPSPTPSLAPSSPTQAVTCPKGGIALEAPSGAAGTGFAETTLSAKANTDFTICFDNQDASVPHNVDLYTAAPPGGTSIAKADILPGPVQELVDVAALAAGTYYYQCDVHPTVMTGTLTVK